MTDTPKFEVIDRRKYKAEEEEREAAASRTEATPPSSVPEPEPEPKKEEPRPGPHLVTESPRLDTAEAGDEPESELDTGLESGLSEAELPPAPTPEESRQQKSA